MLSRISERAYYLELPVCVDDYGEEVWRCHWTSQLVWARDVVWTGSIMPGVHAKYPAGPGYKEIMRLSAIEFNRWDANCNTCAHLERVKHDKKPDGFLYGRCCNPEYQWEKNPYHKFGDGVIAFHPDDWMGMPCYQSRAGGENPYAQ